MTAEAALTKARAVIDAVMPSWVLGNSGRDKLEREIAAALLEVGQPLDGVSLIQSERQRQVNEEGWTPQHDSEHTLSELCRAAIAYALLASKQVRSPEASHDVSFWWPWHASWWKPAPEPIRNLVKAGALIAAEIDRLLRAEAEKVRRG